MVLPYSSEKEALNIHPKASASLWLSETEESTWTSYLKLLIPLTVCYIFCLHRKKANAFIFSYYQKRKLTEGVRPYIIILHLEIIYLILIVLCSKYCYYLYRGPEWVSEKLRNTLMLTQFLFGLIIQTQKVCLRNMGTSLHDLLHAKKLRGWFWTTTRSGQEL